MILDFLRLAVDFGIPTCETGNHHCHDGWVQTHCPYCAGGRSGWHLGWNLSNGLFHCWRCGGVDTRKTLERLTGKKFYTLAQIYNTQSRAQKPPPVVSRLRRLDLPKDCGALRISHQRYLKSRGFCPEDIVRQWEIKGIGPYGGIWAWRILIPIHDSDGRWISYSARSISENVKPRYRTLEDTKAIASLTNVLYGEHHAIDDTVIIVEGPLDVWRMGPGTVALMGAGWTPSQAKRLLKYRKRFIVFDPDKTGCAKAKSLANWLSPYPGESHILTEMTSDPAGLSASDVECLKKQLKLI